METDWLSMIVPSLLTLLGGGGLGWVFTIKWTRKQEEANATKTSQEIYQSIITDLNADRVRLLTELEETRAQVRRVDTRANTLQTQVQLVNRKLNAVIPLVCSIAPTCETKVKLDRKNGERPEGLGLMGPAEGPGLTGPAEGPGLTGPAEGPGLTEAAEGPKSTAEAAVRDEELGTDASSQVTDAGNATVG